MTARTALLALALALVLAGCGRKGDPVPPSEAAARDDAAATRNAD